ncbi:MAG: trypsin-like peptidase domain-containing protein [Rhodothermales bacterium]
MSVKRSVPLALFIIAAFLGGIFFTTLGANLLSNGDITAVSHAASLDSDEGTTVISEELVKPALELEEAFTMVAEAVNPTVVQIRSEKIVQQERALQGTPFEDFFSPYGDREQGQDYRSEGLGSGVIARSDGYIITNNHVIAGADELEVRLFDGNFYDATVVGTDPLSDLAVIKIDADNLPAISYGVNENIRVGQWVMAVGSPLSLDLGNTVTVGIVSAMGRTSDQISNLNLFASFIQTDAAINPGNSGGPLVDLRGRLIGINSAIYSRSGGYQGIGFAIPVDVVENVATQLIDNGAVSRGFLGVGFDGVSETLAKNLDIPRGAAQIVSVLDGSAADIAGLEKSDIITSVDGLELQDANQIRTIIGNKHPGEKVNLDVIRDNRELSISVTLAERSDESNGLAQPNVPDVQDEEESIESIGLRGLRNVTPEILRNLEVENTDVTGIIIGDIDRNSAAYREAELRQRDIIIEIDRQEISSMSEFMRVYKGIDTGDSFLVRVLRPQGNQLVSFLTALEKP